MHKAHIHKGLVKGIHIVNVKYRKLRLMMPEAFPEHPVGHSERCRMSRQIIACDPVLIPYFHGLDTAKYMAGAVEQHIIFFLFGKKLNVFLPTHCSFCHSVPEINAS